MWTLRLWDVGLSIMNWRFLRNKVSRQLKLLTQTLSSLRATKLPTSDHTWYLFLFSAIHTHMSGVHDERMLNSSRRRGDGIGRFYYIYWISVQKASTPSTFFVTSLLVSAPVLSHIPTLKVPFLLRLSRTAIRETVTQPASIFRHFLCKMKRLRLLRIEILLCQQTLHQYRASYGPCSLQSICMHCFYYICNLEPNFHAANIWFQSTQRHTLSWDVA